MPALASSPRMVGRRAELESLLEAFGAGAEGHPRTVIVRGEAGIGKTRLVNEFLAEAATRRDDIPLVIAFGQCIDLGPIGAPFGPIRRVLRDLHGEVGTDALRSAAGSPAVIATLAALVPGIADEGEAGDERAGEFAEAIEVLFETLSATRHLVIVIEDLQWADAATLALLKTFASTLRGRHLTIVATYRSDDVDRFHPLRPVLAELDRTRTIVRIEVGPLSPAEVAEQVALLAKPRDLDQAAVEVLADRSGGIPFLVEELVELEGSGLPDTLRELVLARYTRLTDPAQQVVRAMAAGGMHVDHDVLSGVAGLDDHALDLALREAIDARVVLAEGAGYSFRHALTQEAVHGEMLPSERVRVHRRYAEYLGDNRAEASDTVSAVAEHWLAARDLPAAFDATVLALAQSHAGYSPATSVKLAERLTELWAQIPDAEARAGTTLAQLHLDAAQAWHDLGEPARALRSANEGLALDPEDPLTQAALLRQRFVEVYNTEHENRSDDLDAAIALLEGLDDVRARILLSRVLSNVAIGGHGAEAAAAARRAIELAESAGDDAALAVALTIETWRIADDEDDEPRALIPIERAVTLRLDPSLRAYAASAQVGILGRLGRFEEASLVGAQHYAEAVRAGIERGGGSSIALALASSLFAAGRPAEATRYTHRAMRLVDRPSRGFAVRFLATHYAWNDQFTERKDLLAAERTTIDESLRLHHDKHGWWVIDQGDAVVLTPSASESRISRDAWVDAVRAISTLLKGKGSPSVKREAAVTGALLVATGSAQRFVEDDDAAGLRRLVEASILDWPSHGTAPTLAGFIRATLADADRAPAEERVSAWRPLVGALTHGVMPIWHLHLARFRLATALIESGERDEAAALLASITSEAPGHGVGRLARWASELAEQARLVPATGTHSDDTTGIAALTPRELQVLELVAEGLTNPQIGRRLFISPKTASVHVSAILTKIGASNRAEAAAMYVSGH